VDNKDHSQEELHFVGLHINSKCYCTGPRQFRGQILLEGIQSALKQSC
jgi:hypothetical protein